MYCPSFAWISRWVIPSYVGGFLVWTGRMYGVAGATRSYAEGVMTRPSSTCCPPPRRDNMELAHANSLRCVCSISAYVGLPGAAVRVE